MKIAFTGKGGTGKTTLAGLFIQALSKDGKEILAADCDPDSNLATALGFEGAGKITPIAEMKDMIEKRMGVEKGDRSFFKLNPQIDDIPGKFAKNKGNIKLIVMGAVKGGGSGCMCPENTFIKNLLNHIALKKGEHLVMDMEAGVEHFGRATAESCDFVLTVVEPSLNSIETAGKIKKLARDIGIKKVYALGNKIRKAADIKFIEKTLGDIRLIGTVEFDERFLERSRKGSAAVPEKAVQSIDRIKKILEEDLG